MSRHIASIFFVVLVGCATTNTPPPSNARNAKAARPKPAPNLDRTYDWGARPPTANPDRNSD